MSRPVDTCSFCGGPDYVPHERIQCATSIIQSQREALEAAVASIPTTWLDPLLTGPDRVMGQPPYDGEDIENLLRAVKARVAKRIDAILGQAGKEGKDG